MVPTIQKSEIPVKDIKDKRLEKRPDSLICRVKYTNTLPDVPFDPKFIHYFFGLERFIKHNSTSLERNYKHDLITDPDVGVEVDLIDPLIFQVNPQVKLHPDDEKLLEDDISGSFDARRSRHHNKYVSWMRKTEYISNEHCNKITKNEKLESRIGNKKQMLKEDDVYRDRQSQIDAIESTFNSAKEQLVKHYSKPNVVAEKIFPILPDFKLWKHPCAQVIFDDDPLSQSTDKSDTFNRALIRGMVDESGQHFVAYFLPTENTKQKLKREAEDDLLFSKEESYEYFLAREYNWNVKNKGMTNYEENYFLVFRSEGAFYNELETRVRLNKRRKIGPSNAVSSNLKTKLHVKHREFNDSEFKAQADRLSMLEQEIDEDEEISEDENNTEIHANQNDEPDNNKAISDTDSNSDSS